MTINCQLPFQTDTGSTGRVSLTCLTGHHRRNGACHLGLLIKMYLTDRPIEYCVKWADLKTIVINRTVIVDTIGDKVNGNEGERLWRNENACEREAKCFLMDWQMRERTSPTLVHKISCGQRFFLCRPLSISVEGQLPKFSGITVPT